MGSVSPMSDVVVIGSGFAGLWAALGAARRLDELGVPAGEVTIKDLDAGRAAAAAITDNDAWKAERPGQMKIRREGLVAAITSIIE